MLCVSTRRGLRPAHGGCGFSITRVASRTFIVTHGNFIMTDHLYTTLGSGWRYNHPYWDILIFTNFYAKYDCMGWWVAGERVSSACTPKSPGRTLHTHDLIQRSYVPHSTCRCVYVCVCVQIPTNRSSLTLDICWRMKFIYPPSLPPPPSSLLLTWSCPGQISSYL